MFGLTTFRDPKGREFRCVIDTAAVADIQRELSIDIRDVVDCRIDFDDRMTGGAKLIAILWIAVRGSAESQQVTPEDFGRSLGGDSLDDAVDALLQAIVSFSPRSQRPALQAVLEKGAAVRDVVARKMVDHVEGVDPEKVAEKVMIQLSTGTFAPLSDAMNLGASAE